MMSSESTYNIIQCADVLEKVLQDYCEILNRQRETVTSKIIVSEDGIRYLVITEGWNNNQRIHSLTFDAEIRDNKIWLHHDGLDHGITDDLLEGGITKDQIVLAFHPPHIRQHTGYGVA